MDYRFSDSRRLAGLLAAAGAGALALVACADLSPETRAGIGVLLLFGLALRFGRGREDIVRAVRPGEADRCQVLLGDGRWHPAQVLASTFVTPHLTIMNLRLSELGRRCSVAVLSDSLPEEDFRRLRVWLKWRCRAEKPAGTA